MTPTLRKIDRLSVRSVFPGTDAEGTLIMVHGGCHDWWAFESWMQSCARSGFAVHALSLRGHGDSWPMPPAEFCALTVDDYRDDIIRACEALGVVRPVLIGHSLGGIAAQLAAQTLDCAALVLVSSAGPAALGTRRGLLPADRLVIRTPEEARQRYFHSAPAEVVAGIVAKLVPESPGALNTSGGRAVVDATLIGCPVLALSGAEDATDVPSAHQLAKLYGGTALVLPDTGHNIMQEAAGQKACDFIVSWLRCVL
ncbi:alpha/beta hydrolase [Roseomonas sp. HJA6]|uniref:Alpha/beta hydrolase n=1 Tax=Roseomonas alba TaxID=2846776 RepID=A0ABS7A297_9PROT|nr:alpha/beta hydrolase [Neoroseomonas alba]MBW6396414.1 alpha/beta hydrolase [Neoroseomonas alba]